MQVNKCKKCNGACCKEMFLNLGKYNKADKYHKDYVKWIKLHGIKTKIVNNNLYIQLKIKCTKLKNGKCLIYKHRPLLCKEFNCNDLFFIRLNKRFN